MSSVEKKTIQQILRNLGSCNCPHFELGRIIGKQKGCCGGTHQFSYFPTCKLSNTSCEGIQTCPRLDPETKSIIEEQWKQDVARNKIFKPSIKDLK
jgi:hypothetical protein